MATLYDRPVQNLAASIAGGTHSYWQVQVYDPNSGSYVLDEIISGIRNPATDPATGATKSYIDVVVHASYQYESDPRLAADQPSGGTAWYTTGLNASNCDGVAGMLSTAWGWQNDTIPYGFQHAVNSNTVAHLMGNAGGFYPSAPLGSFGW
jgi:hypothetical protein